MGLIFCAAVPLLSGMSTSDVGAQAYYSVDPYFSNNGPEQNVDLYINDVYMETVWSCGYCTMPFNSGAAPEGYHIFEAIGQDFGYATTTEYIYYNSQSVNIGELSQSSTVITVQPYASLDGPAQYVDVYVDGLLISTDYVTPGLLAQFVVDVTVGHHTFTIQGWDYGSATLNTYCSTNNQYIDVGNLGQPVVYVDIKAYNDGPAQGVSLYIDTVTTPLEASASAHSWVYFNDVQVTIGTHDFQVVGWDFGNPPVYSVYCSDNNQVIDTGTLTQPQVYVDIKAYNDGPAQGVSLYIDTVTTPLEASASAHSWVYFNDVQVTIGTHDFQVVGWDFGTPPIYSIYCSSNNQVIDTGTLTQTMVSVDIYADNNGPAQWVDIYVDTEQSPRLSMLADANSTVWFRNISVTPSYHEFTIQGRDFGSVWDGTECQVNGQDIYIGQLNQSMILVHIYVLNSGPAQQVDLYVDDDSPATSSLLANANSEVWFRDIPVTKGYHGIEIYGNDFGYADLYWIECQFSGQEIYVGELKHLPPYCSLSANPNRGPSPLNVVFSLDILVFDGFITSWSLDIDDDGVAEYSDASSYPPATLQYTYSDPGIYSVKLEAIDEYGKINSAYTLITVLTDDTPVALWHFDQEGDNIAYDSSGNNNHGIIYGAQWTEGISGNALYFDGTNDYVAINDSDSLDVTTEITIEAWIKPSLTSTSYIVSKLNPTIGGGVYALDIYPGKTRAILQKEGGGSTDYGASGTSSIRADIWQHLAVTWDGTIVKIYYNGRLEGTNLFSGQIATSTGSLIIGNYLTTYFKGYIDEIRIYDYALDEKQLQIHALPATVFIDDDYTVLTPGWNYTHFSIIQDGIHGVAVNGTLYVSPGQYTENLQVYKSVTLLGENKNLTIIDGGEIFNVISVAADWVTINNFTIRNSGRMFPGGCGIVIVSYHNTITNNNINSNAAIGISVTSSNNNIFSRNLITDNGFGGIQLLGSHNNMMTNNVVSNVTYGGEGGNGIELWECTNNTIINNAISNNPSYGIDIGSSQANTVINNSCSQNYLGSIFLYNSSFNILEWNKCSQSKYILHWNYSEYGEGYGITIYWHSENNSIQNNTITNSNDDSIYLYESNNNTITANTITNTTYDGMDLEYSNNNKIMGNTITNSTDDGIELYESSNNRITANILTSNIVGIHLVYSSSNTIKENTITNTTYEGIELDESNNNNITGNTITNSTDDGIYLEYSNNNTIKENTITNTTYEGIELDESNNNTITTNIITNNKLGIYLPYSNNNIIYHNNFINNSEHHATTYAAGVNIWDDGYPSGGNYWDDYTGVDTNGDYIGDTPYSITGGNDLDRYPLMMPYTLIINQLPICTLSVNPTSGIVPLTVTFTLSASDPDGTITTWKLDINNDGTADYSGSGTPPSTQQHTYQTAGSYTTRFTVTDNDGATNSATKTITVNQPGQNQAPTCTLTANPTSGNPPLTVTFTLSASDPDGTITTWKLDINNDGTADYSGSGTPPSTQQHTYTTPGTHTAKLTVTDNKGLINTDTTTIAINPEIDNQPPVANFTYSIDGGIVIFTDDSTDPDGIIAAWYWDFGDQNHSNISNPTHEYEKEGNYTVRLTITDSNGETDSCIFIIIVESGTGSDEDGGIPGFEIGLLVAGFITVLMTINKKKTRNA